MSRKTNDFAEDPAIQSYVRLIRTAEAMHSEVSRGLVSEGLTASQFSTLKVLAHRGALAQRDIAKYLLRTGGNVTVVLDNLERRGLIERIRDTQDRRVIHAGLTPEGRSLFERVYPPHLDRIRRAMAALEEEECGHLVGILNKLHAEIGPATCQALPEEPDAVPATAEG
jgi:MarR family transcriptional regulator, 2-MHQ and catechol-resistance regulon repressor